MPRPDDCGSLPPPTTDRSRWDLAGEALYLCLRSDVVAEVERLRDPDGSVEGPGSRSAFASAFASATVHGIHFTVAGRRYEVRATAQAGGSFGLFDCTGAPPSPCERVRELSGGFGTTGERVVFSLPLESIGLGHGGGLGDLEAFTAVGGVSGRSREGPRLVRYQVTHTSRAWHLPRPGADAVQGGPGQGFWALLANLWREAGEAPRPVGEML